MLSVDRTYGRHSLFRICVQHTSEYWSKQGYLWSTYPISNLVSGPGKRWDRPIGSRQETQIETNLNTSWEPGEEALGEERHVRRLDRGVACSLYSF
jgi:hypothetical protein